MASWSEKPPIWHVVSDNSGWAVDKLFTYLVEQSGGRVEMVPAKSWQRIVGRRLIFSYLGLFTTMDVLLCLLLRKSVAVCIFHVNFADRRNTRLLHLVIGNRFVKTIVVPNETLRLSLELLGVQKDRLKLIPIPVSNTFFQAAG
jgi:hypothetical protein